MSGRCITRMLTASPTFTTKPRTCSRATFAAAATSRRRTPGRRLRLGVKDALDVHVRVGRGHRPRLRVRIGVAEDGVSGRHLGLLRLRWGANFLLAVRFYCCVSRRVFERGRAATARRRGGGANRPPEQNSLPKSVSATADRRPSHARPAVCECCRRRRGFSPPKRVRWHALGAARTSSLAYLSRRTFSAFTLRGAPWAAARVSGRLMCSCAPLESVGRRKLTAST